MFKMIHPVHLRRHLFSTIIRTIQNQTEYCLIIYFVNYDTSDIKFDIADM